MLRPMELQPTPQRQRYLAPEIFVSYLLWLSPDPRRAAREYLDIRKTLIKFFVRKGCPHAEELTDRTLDRVVQTVHREPEKYDRCGIDVAFPGSKHEKVVRTRAEAGLMPSSDVYLALKSL